MKNFMHRTVEINSTKQFFDGDGEPFHLSVIRSRNSHGHCSIEAKAGGSSVTFTSDLSDDYEAVAIEFASLILAMCNEPCNLPEIPPTK